MLITMGCGGECPYVPGLRRADWSLPDPKGLPLNEVRTIRDTIHDHVERLVNAEGLA
jgi:arsenate reductase (thioredoxin)